MYKSISFLPDNPGSRLDYLKKLAPMIFILAIINFFVIISPTYPEIGPVILVPVEIIFGSIFLLPVLIPKIITGITIDYTNQQFIATYITLFKNERYMVIPFDDFTYDYRKVYSKSSLRGMTKLFINSNGKKRFTIIQSQDNWSLKTLEEINKNLERL